MWTPDQDAILHAPLAQRLFLSGPAGTGKTSVGVGRMLALLAAGIPGDDILVVVPQRTLAAPYDEALRQMADHAGSLPTIATYGSLARQIVDIFWPLVPDEVGLRQPSARPIFLSLETAQYVMAHLVRPHIDDEGMFDGVAVHRNRIYSQIIDNLNKAALVGFPLDEIAPRLKAAWIGEPGQLNVYDDVQSCALEFRAYCLEHNLIDFSLQVTLFQRLWELPPVQSFVQREFRYLLADNLEEDTPALHDLLAQWLPEIDGALLIYDTEAGYRRFLAADPDSAYALRERCDAHLTLSESFVTAPELGAFGVALARSLERAAPDATPDADPRAGLHYEDHRYHPQMLDWVAEEVGALIHHEGVPPGEIVILAPFLSDALRFALMSRLEVQGVPTRSHRPSRALRDEPAARALLTLARLAHPEWGIVPDRYAITAMLMEAIDGLDLVRAQLLAGRVKEGDFLSFEDIVPAMQERITHAFGGRYEQLRAWLRAYREEPLAELDIFFSKLFGEVLSQPGFGFHRRFDAATVAANLIDSARGFRWTVDAYMDTAIIGREYVHMVGDGVIANQYVRAWEDRPEADDAVLLAPAYTFLMRNRPVDVQVWLNVASDGWSKRLLQPLTHPYVLSRQWSGGPWTDLQEAEITTENLYRLALGLIRRCRYRVYLGFSQLGEQGYEQRGALLEAIQRMLRRLALSERSDKDEDD